MEVIALAFINLLQLLALAYITSRLRGMRRLTVFLLRDLLRDLASLDPEQPISKFPYRAEFMLALELLIRILNKEPPGLQIGKER